MPLTNLQLDEPALVAAKQDLAACFRMAAKLRPVHRQALGLASGEICASDLQICNHDGGVVAGDAKGPTRPDDAGNDGDTRWSGRAASLR